MTKRKRPMKIFLDCSDPDLLKPAIDTGLVDGVTTNPTLMKKQGMEPVDVIYKISELFSWSSSVSAEVVGETADEMLAMAVDYYQIAPNVTIKLPCTVEGLKACSDLTEDGIKTNITLIFSAAQAILAAKAGATYVSPFVGRVYDQSFDGIGLIKDISSLYMMHDIETQVLSASIRDVKQVTDSYKAGADVVTMPLPIFYKMYKHVLTDTGLSQFNKDWEQLQSDLNNG
tara:strand:+ start:3177 stop:3863 length:687 start_codon:yes stop_codon:yes gene_type:complete